MTRATLADKVPYMLTAREYRHVQCVEGLTPLAFAYDELGRSADAIAAWAERFKADPSRWRFLTGDAEQLRVVVRSMMLAAEKAAPGPDGSYNVVHSEKFVLLDADGNIRGFYSANTEGLDRMVQDATGLVP